jgi:hypothetical protein
LKDDITCIKDFVIEGHLVSPFWVELRRIKVG